MKLTDEELNLIHGAINERLITLAIRIARDGNVDDKAEVIAQKALKKKILIETIKRPTWRKYAQSVKAEVEASIQKLGE